VRIDTDREGGSARLRLEGRLDREGAERLSDTIEDLLQEGVRSLNIDFSGVSYVSTAATRVLTRWRDELAVLRGDVHLVALPPGAREVLAAAGWDGSQGIGEGSLLTNLRRSSWHSRLDFTRCGQYEVSSSPAAGTLECRLHGDPDRLARTPYGPDDCRTVSLPEASFGVGVGAIGKSYEESHQRFGELVGVAGCVAYYPSDGARLPDYLVGDRGLEPKVVLASGLTCTGGFARLMRFTTKPESEEVPLSELAAAGLDAVGGRMAGLVIAGEAAGLVGARLRQSPADAGEPLRFEVPAVRDWLSFAPERIHAMTTTLIAGVVARAPRGPIAAHLRPLDATGGLHGHFHAAVFSYHPLPQRTVELPTLVRGLFDNHQLRDVLHLLWDERGEAGVGETALLRGVGWAAPISSVT
jgi:anti-anti-sigma factor